MKGKRMKCNLNAKGAISPVNHSPGTSVTSHSPLIRIDRGVSLPSPYVQEHGACSRQEKSSARRTKVSCTPSGISRFDKQFVGLVSNSLNIVQTYDEEPANVIQGAFMRHGLNHGEKVVLISYMNPKHYFRKLAQFGFTGLKRYLESEQLIYLYYKPTFTKSFHLSFDYKRLFSEINQIAGSQIDRLVLDNCDVFFNLQSPQLAKVSAVKLMSALEGRQYTTLGTFMKGGEQDACNLGQICESTMVSYLSFDGDTAVGETGTYRFNIKKLPHVPNCETLTLKLGGQKFAGKSLSESVSTEKPLPLHKHMLLAN